MTLLHGESKCKWGCLKARVTSTSPPPQAKQKGTMNHHLKPSLSSASIGCTASWVLLFCWGSSSSIFRFGHLHSTPFRNGDTGRDAARNAMRHSVRRALASDIPWKSKNFNVPSSPPGSRLGALSVVPRSFSRWLGSGSRRCQRVGRFGSA